MLFSDSEEKLEAGRKEAAAAFAVSSRKPELPVLIKEIIE